MSRRLIDVFTGMRLGGLGEEENNWHRESHMTHAGGKEGEDKVKKARSFSTRRDDRSR